MGYIRSHDHLKRFDTDHLKVLVQELLDLKWAELAKQEDLLPR